MMGAVEHVSVLFEQALAGLDVRPGGKYIDATVGAGGLTAGILRMSLPDGKVLGLDADPSAIEFARQALSQYGSRVVLQAGNFRDLVQHSTRCGFDQVDGIVMDLGLSSRQLAEAGRGFSFSQDAPLDMRFDMSQGQPASRLINSLPETELADLIWRYGEERLSRRIARAIVSARPVYTTAQLAGLVARVVGRSERIHPATRTFQALRIAVNDEIGALERALPQARDLLSERGRLVVISFHSLEDRVVKSFLQREARDCLCPPDMPTCTCGHRRTVRIVTRKPIVPTPEEVTRNPRSRSAKLRIAERLENALAPSQQGSRGT